MNENTSKVNLKKSIWNWPNFFGHLAIFYGYWIASAMLQQYLRYDAFDINIFHFSQVSDFPLAPFRDADAFYTVLLMIAVTVIGCLVTYVLIRLSRFIRASMSLGKRKREIRLRGSAIGLLSSVTGIYVLLLIGIGQIAGNAFYNDAWKYNLVYKAETRVRWSLSSEGHPVPGDFLSEFTVIGTTADYVFLHNLRGETLILPAYGAVLESKSDELFQGEDTKK